MKKFLIEFKDINFELKEKEHIIPIFFIGEDTEVNHSIFYLVNTVKKGGKVDHAIIGEHTSIYENV